MLTHLEKENLHKLIPRAAPQHKCFAHTHTHSNPACPERTCTHTGTAGYGKYKSSSYWSI